jgi:hypothetical protein
MGSRRVAADPPHRKKLTSTEGRRPLRRESDDRLRAGIASDHRWPAVQAPGRIDSLVPDGRCRAEPGLGGRLA